MTEIVTTAPLQHGFFASSRVCINAKVEQTMHKLHQQEVCRQYALASHHRRLTLCLFVCLFFADFDVKFSLVEGSFFAS